MASGANSTTETDHVILKELTGGRIGGTGGAIFGAFGGTVIVKFSTFEDCWTPRDEQINSNDGDNFPGGVIYVFNHAHLYIDHSRFWRNTAFSGGAIAISTGADGVITSTVFEMNRATRVGGGGAISVTGGSIVIDTCHFISNQAAGIAMEGRFIFMHLCVNHSCYPYRQTRGHENDFATHATQVQALRCTSTNQRR
jgi:predicted outer membrane repeat protein